MSIDPTAFLASVTAAPPVHHAPNSRYRDIPTAELTNPDGTSTVHLRRRFVPEPDLLATVGRVRVRDGDRIDTLAAEVFGDPTLFWRLADTGLEPRPAALTAEPGRVLRVTAAEGIPGGGGA
ncbi:LysM domain-containing protein [Streptomyces triculaminicus]|uniref:LysM domain-containing protein n=2 Tax=Streptomyces TaxID=1883 RepID=A0A939JSB3_9ACTN|nr:MULTISPECIES: LysM domain-containing protein [Streptomyces]MBO0654494.1 LysM domain-containing protein [Streptomyces triculaminicus]QSY49109.1 LysM domain-containing protein [Streptomyces griseocarneus]